MKISLRDIGLFTFIVALPFQWISFGAMMRLSFKPIHIALLILVLSFVFDRESIYKINKLIKAANPFFIFYLS